MKPRLAQVHQSGATTGQVATWDGTKWAPAVVAGPTRASDLSTAYLPLTTDTGGVPDLVWDADNQLVVTETPIP